MEAQANIGLEVAEKLVKYSDNGTSTSSVNFPEVALPAHPGKHRLLHIHRNVPGVLSRHQPHLVGQPHQHRRPVPADQREGRLCGDRHRRRLVRPGARQAGPGAGHHPQPRAVLSPPPGRPRQAVPCLDRSAPRARPPRVIKSLPRGSWARSARPRLIPMNVPIALTALQSQAAEPARLREIPYNYTSLLRPGDRDPPARQPALGRAATACAASAAPGAPPACSTRCWATSGWCSATPTCTTTCSTTRAGAASWSTRSTHRLAEVEKRRTPQVDAERDRLVGELVQAAQRAVAEFDATFARPRPCAAACQRRLGRLTAKDNIKFDGLSRVSPRDRRHRLARRIPVRRAHARHRGRDGRPGQGLHRAGPDHHSARRRHRLHRRRHSADLEERGHQHRKARGHDRGRDAPRCPAWTTTCATIWTEAGVVTQRVADAAERAGFVFAVDPTAPRPRASAATWP